MPAVNREILLNVLDEKLQPAESRLLIRQFELDAYPITSKSKRDRLAQIIDLCIEQGLIGQLIGHIAARWPDLLKANSEYLYNGHPGPDPRHAPNGLTARQLMGRGEKRFTAGLFDSAIQDFSLAIQLDPVNADAYCWRAIVRITQGDHKQAIQDLTDAIYYNPDKIEAYHNRAVAYYPTDRLRAALDLAHVFDTQPNFARAYATQAQWYANARKWESAITFATKALARDSNLGEAYAVRARTYTETQAFDLAIADLSSVIHLNPYDAEARRARAEIYLKVGALDQALRDFTIYLEDKPSHPDVRIARARLYARLGVPEEAVADYNTAIRDRPDRGYLYGERASVHFAQGDYFRCTRDALRHAHYWIFDSIGHVFDGIEKLLHD